MQGELGAALTVEDFVLVGLSYRHGNIGRVGVEALQKILELTRRGGAQGVGILRQDL
jgi:hypothetical protein